MQRKKTDADIVSNFIATQTGADAAISPKPTEKAEKSPTQLKKEKVVAERKAFMAQLAAKKKTATPPSPSTDNKQATPSSPSDNSPQARKYGSPNEFFQKKPTTDTTKADETLKALKDKNSPKPK